MKFTELNLLIAIRRTPDLGSDKPTDAKRLEYARAVHANFVAITGDIQCPFNVDDVIIHSINMRKQPDTRTKADIAELHGSKCFWESRGKGPCSDDVEAGHLVPACLGGEMTVENGIIECRAHNNQRRELTIEEYLRSDKVTV